MTNKTGIWIDHKRALIVNIDSKNVAKYLRVESGFEGREREEGEGKGNSSTRMGTQFMRDEKGIENRKKELLNKFYLEVMLRISDDADVYIFGPASAKDELAAKLRSYQSLKISTVKVETADKMTDKEVAAKTRDYFQLENVAA